jgi:hypothetical protein
MRAVLYVVTFFSVIALAFWAYRENYATQQALNEVDQLHADIRQAHARLAVLRAEWAYQNRPDRLHDLVKMNFGRLGLLPLRSDQFGYVDQVIYPPKDPLPILNPVDVSTLSAQEGSL